MMFDSKIVAVRSMYGRSNRSMCMELNSAERTVGQLKRHSWENEQRRTAESAREGEGRGGGGHAIRHD